MAISHIGRMLRQRAEQERLKTAMDILAGAIKDLPQLGYAQGYAQGIKWAIEEIERIESEGS